MITTPTSHEFAVLADAMKSQGHWLFLRVQIMNTKVITLWDFKDGRQSVVLAIDAEVPRRYVQINDGTR